MPGGMMKAELLSVFGDGLMVVNTARVSMGKWHDESKKQALSNKLFGEPM